MAFNCKACEFAALVGTIDPAVIVDTPVFSDEIDMSPTVGWDEVLCVLAIGNVNAKTIDFAVWEDDDGAAGNTQALLACTQLAASAGDNDNMQLIINVRRNQLSAGFTHIRMRVVSEAAQDGPLGAVAFGMNSGPIPAQITCTGGAAPTGEMPTGSLASVGEVKKA